jgi:hypothetical protein
MCQRVPGEVVTRLESPSDLGELIKLVAGSGALATLRANR